MLRMEKGEQDFLIFCGGTLKGQGGVIFKRETNLREKHVSMK